MGPLGLSRTEIIRAARSTGKTFSDDKKHEGSGPKNVADLADSLGTVKEELLREYIDICEVRNSKESTYTFPSVITPIESTSTIGKCLYKEEYDNMDNLERDTIVRITSQENIKWWHRNPERKNNESFCLRPYGRI